MTRPMSATAVRRLPARHRTSPSDCRTRETLALPAYLGENHGRRISEGLSAVSGASYLEDRGAINF
jgi:hypothetical protein